MGEPWFLTGLEPGEQGVREHAVLALATGSELMLRAIVLRGTSAGPRIYIGSTLHGDEVGGIGVITELIRRLSMQEVRGDVVLVPIQNPLAFMQRQRLIPGHAFDTFGVDLADAFDGPPDGEVGERIAGTLLNEFISHCDVAIDIHTALAGGENLDYCFTPAGSGEVISQARQLARRMRFPLIMEQEQGSYVSPRKLHQAAASRGVPAFCVELLEAGYISPAITHRCVEGIENLMRHMGMLEGEVLSDLGDQRVVTNAAFIRAPRGGIYRPTAELGAELEAGDELGILYDTYLSWQVPVRTDVAGVVYRRSHHRPVHESERIASIGF